MSTSAIRKVDVIKMKSGTAISEHDQVVVEEPLEIRILYWSDGTPRQKTVSITMRTPGNDKELAVGFLFTEGIITKRSEIKMVTVAADGPNTTLVILQENVEPLLVSAERNFYTTSSCGICGKTSIESIRAVSIFNDVRDDITIEKELICGMPTAVKKQQEIFENTGGLHASALFSLNEGHLIGLHEDVGRHNALDKLIGRFFLDDMLPLSQNILFLSGRAGFELVQKAYMAGIKIVAAVGAPSSLAVELADSNNMTLIGFLRGDRYNVYSGFQRIR